MKVYTLAPSENWIVDRMTHEFVLNNCEISTLNPQDADIIWLMSDWCWKKIPLDLLSKKKVLTTIHHIVENKFGINEQNDFRMRDSITNEYHCFNTRTADFVSKYTNKKINIVPYWVDLNYWKRPDGDYLTIRNEARQKLNLPQDAFIISSFQRDTEGHDLKSPKLEKGADLLCDVIETFYQTNRYENIQILLGGWRRQFVINRLKKAKIPFIYKELPELDVIKDMYLASNLYIVASRCEGGPQALLEAPALKVPCISRPVGIAEQILASRSIHDDVSKALPNIDAAYKNVCKLDMNNIFPQYIDMFQKLL